MEAGGRICEEWSSLSGFYTAEEADFMTQLLSNTCAVQHEPHQEIPNPSFHESTVVSVAGINNNTSCFPSIVGNDSLSSFDSMCMGFAWGDAKFMPCSVEISDEELVKRALAVADKNLQANRECQTQVSESAEKRSRSSLEIKRNVKPKKNTKPTSMSNNEEDRSLKQSSSSCCSEEYDSNGGATSSLSPKESAALNSNAKSMPHKGHASDPQSLYARRTRERINERLRILQNLVPNGTKVDISTMLEEAVQYVKFLQLQIKLLSSDDLWMYAPIAYNGLNIGLDLNFTPTKQP